LRRTPGRVVLSSGIVRVLAFLAILLIGAIVATPIGIVILTGLWSTNLNGTGHFTLDNYASLLTSARALRLLVNSVVFAAGGTVLAVGLGTVMAWAVTSINLPGRAFLRILPLCGLLLASLLKDTSWIAFFSPNTGLVNLGLQHAFGLKHPILDIYTLLGMIIVTGFNTAPVAYLLLLAPFEGIDRSFGEASRISGARGLRTFWHVVAPTLRPAIFSATALTLIIIAATFETPILIGLPGGVGTYMSIVFESITGGGAVGFNAASAQSSVFLILTSLVLFWYLVATRRARRFVSISGRGHQHDVTRMPILRYVLSGFIVLYALISFIGPLVLTVLVSLLPYYTVTAGNPFHDFTFDNYRAILSGPQLINAIVTSGTLAATVIVTAVATGGFLTFVALKGGHRLGRIADVTGMAPIALPAMVYSVALLITTLSIPGLGPIAYGTAIPMIVAETVVFLPFAVRFLGSALIQVQDELIEASTISGASPIRTAAFVVAPILRPAIAYTAAIIFLLSYRELGAVVLLVTPNTNLISTLTFNTWTEGGYNEVAALNIITLVVPLIFLIVAFLVASLSRRRPSSELASRTTSLRLEPDLQR
jgi:iron(III) transport system permease protein